MLNPARVVRLAPRGLSLVELMVGIAVGMFVVAAASMVAATQLSENRRLLAETQVQQDLRAAADIVVREVRRAAVYGRQQDAASLSWVEGAGAELNGNQAVTLTGGTQVDLLRARTSVGSVGYSTFMLSNGVLRSRAGASSTDPLQDLTDANSLEVTAFTVQAQNEPPVALPCVRPCPQAGLVAPDAECRPTTTVRRLTVALSGRPRAGGTERTVSSEVRLRNDFIQYGNAPACP